MEIVHDSDEKPIDTNDFKDAFLASLYGQFEFLRSQLEEKYLLIRTLIIRDNVIRDNESYTRGNPSLKCNDDCNSTYSNSDRCFNGEYVDEIEDGEEDFKTLYQQFEDQIGTQKHAKEKLEAQLNDLRNEKQQKYLQAKRK